MRRLYLQIYLTIIAILVIVIIAVGALWRIAAASRFDHAIEAATEFADNELPPVGAPQPEVRAALERLHRRLAADVALYASDDTLIADAGRPIPAWRRDRAGGWVPGRGGPSWALTLDDERTIVIRIAPPRPQRGLWLIAVLTALAAAVAVGAYPLAR